MEEREGRDAEEGDLDINILDPMMQLVVVVFGLLDGLISFL